MTTHSFTSLRPFALSFGVLVLIWSTTARIHGAPDPLSTHFPKVAESGDYLQDDSDGGAGSGMLRRTVPARFVSMIRRRLLSMVRYESRSGQ